MSSRLDNFTETENSDNRPVYVEPEKLQEIVIGATCTHTFTLPFVYSEVASNMLLTYKHGSEILLEKDLSDSDLTFDETTTSGSTIITVVLLPSETLLFSNKSVQTRALIMITNTSNEVSFLDPEDIVVIRPLEY